MTEINEKTFCDHILFRGKKKGEKCGINVTNPIKNKGKCYKHKKCKHGKHYTYCFDCGSGVALCKKHGKNKSLCRECGGNGRCIHDRERTTCKDCEGGSICEHKRRKSQCKECKGESICSHGKMKNICFLCGGTSLCEHRIQKSNCKKCMGACICSHKRRRDQCVDCNGVGICEHKKKKHVCVECKGNAICKHNKIRLQCYKCDIDIHPQNWCLVCKCTRVVQSKYKPFCFQCHQVTFPDAPSSVRFRLREQYLKDELIKQYPDQHIIYNNTVAGGCSARRPDFLIDLITHSIIIECDEDQHFNYSCENKRMMEIFQDLGNRPLVVIRFNPDSYLNNEGQIQDGCFKSPHNKIIKKEWYRRLDELFTQINYFLVNIPEKEMSLEYLFYSSDKEDKIKFLD